MANGKIDKTKMYRMLRAGKTQKEIAKHFGVTEGAVSQAKKELNTSVIKNVSLENAHRIVDQELNTVEQLQKINENANELLDMLMRWNRGDAEALQELGDQVGNKDPRELALKTMAEIRNQLKLQLEIFQALYDMKAVGEFQQEVLDAISEEDDNVRRKILDRLAQRRAIRTAIR